MVCGSNQGILTNEIYTGTMVQGKREKVNYKVKKILEKPESEWCKVEGTHEAIVSKVDYQKVQRLLEVDTRAEKGKEKAHMFSGILFCGDCKERWVRRMNRYKGTEKRSYICSTRNRSEGCETPYFGSGFKKSLHFRSSVASKT